MLITGRNSLDFRDRGCADSAFSSQSGISVYRVNYNSYSWEFM